jgi:hypothetical protein
MARKTLREKFIDLLEVNNIKEEKQDGYIQLRLNGLGFRNPCSRCGGSGIYSRFHGTCFRCGGRGNDPIKLTTVNYNEAVALVEAGKLKEYFEIVKLKQKLEKSDDIIFKLMNDNELSRDYSIEYSKEKWRQQPDGTWGYTYKMNTIIKELRFRQSDYHKEYLKIKDKHYKKYFSKDRKGQFINGTDEDRKFTLELLDELFEEYKQKLIDLNTNYENMKQMFIEIGQNKED